jgi:hypothetical protein
MSGTFAHRLPQTMSNIKRFQWPAALEKAQTLDSLGDMQLKVSAFFAVLGGIVCLPPYASL